MESRERWRVEGKEGRVESREVELKEGLERNGRKESGVLVN